MTSEKDNKKDNNLGDINVMHAQPFSKQSLIGVLDISYGEIGEDFLAKLGNFENAWPSDNPLFSSQSTSFQVSSKTSFLDQPLFLKPTTGETVTIEEDLPIAPTAHATYIPPDFLEVEGTQNTFALDNTLGLFQGIQQGGLEEKATGKKESDEDFQTPSSSDNEIAPPTEVTTGIDVFTTDNSADLAAGGAEDDTLYASVDGTWSGFVAHNVETGQNISLTGKTMSSDVFNGGVGYDTIELGDTSDALFLDNSFSNFYNNTNQARIIDVEEINAGGGDDIIDLTSNIYSVGDITINGGEGNDTLWSSDGNDSLYGQAGNDSLYGGQGDDLLDGGAGTDTLAGGAGNDTFIFDVNDTSIDGGTGTDTVKITDGSFDFSTLDGLLSNVEVLDLNGGADLTVDSAFVASANGGGYTMQIDGDNTSQVTFEDTFTDGGTTTIGGQDYTIYTSNDTILHIDTDITVIMP